MMYEVKFTLAVLGALGVAPVTGIAALAIIPSTGLLCDPGMMTCDGITYMLPVLLAGTGGAYVFFAYCVVGITRGEQAPQRAVLAVHTSMVAVAPMCAVGLFGTLYLLMQNAFPQALYSALIGAAGLIPIGARYYGRLPFMLACVVCALGSLIILITARWAFLISPVLVWYGCSLLLAVGVTAAARGAPLRFRV